MTTTHPTADQKWFDDFIITLRARSIPGTQIGEALAEVKEFCADSGQSPLDAFGPAREYAETLPLAPRTDRREAALASLPPTIAGLIAMMAAPAAVRAWRHGTAVDVSWPLVIGVGLAILVGLATGLLPQQLSRARVLVPVVLVFAIVLGAAIAFLPGGLTMPLWLAAALGVVGTIIHVLGNAADRSDPIVDPTMPPRTRKRDWVVWFNMLGVPVATLLFCLLALLR